MRAVRNIPALLAAPLAMLPSAAIGILERYRAEALAPSVVLQEARLVGDVLVSPDDWKPYDVVSGIAIIPICGVLVHERSWWSWGETSYSEIATMIGMAVADDAVKGIALDVNSPGGTVSGCFDLCDAIYEMRGSKPIWSIVNEDAYSAAYAIASCADRIILPRTGGVGSVGVITMHIDITKMLEDFGVKVTTIQFGDRKSDSYPTTPLSDEARARLQADVDTLGELFVDMVARNRGIEASAVRDTQAGCFMGENGVDVGFADAVMATDAAIMEFIDFVNTGENA